ncbi:MAG: thiamine pyrophosphate-dependent dehydrogenase E1 component subunit alpha [Actinomycetota bacterium]|nr:thiamine pyrophosphate-dependent dehydrogenase E1 component subunit alpha [Actinomycetota bacterium]
MTTAESSTDQRLLASMLRIRMVEQTIADRYSEQEMRCPVHLSIGQEAPAAAMSLVAEPADYAVSTHRGHAHYLAKGGDLSRMIAEIYGKVGGCSRGRGGSMHLADPSVGFMGTSAIVGNSIPVGVGLGMALQIKAQPNVSFVFLGDGATEEGVFYESANFAALRKLPVIFMCENNQYSVYSNLEERQPASRRIVEVARALGVPALEVDGNDARASHVTVANVVAQTRAGAGPALIEFETHRLREHCGPNWDDELGYRKPGELASWLKRDPIKALLDSGTFDPEWIESTTADIRTEIDAAFRFAKNSPYPDPAELAEDVYA